MFEVKGHEDDTSIKDMNGFRQIIPLSLPMHTQTAGQTGCRAAGLASRTDVQAAVKEQSSLPGSTTSHPQ